MLNTERATHYCPTCGYPHRTEEAAKRCAEIPVRHDLGVKAGDWVVVLAGPHRGLSARVDRVRIMRPALWWWGRDKFVHTVVLDVSIPKRGVHQGAWTAVLTFEEYGVRR